MNKNTQSDAYVKVATVGDIKPGEMKRVEAHGDRILLINYEHELYALCDTCSHEDASLYLGVLNGDTIRCPLHGSRFNIKTGMPMEEPAEEPVSIYPVQIKQDQILLGPKEK